MLSFRHLRDFGVKNPKCMLLASSDPAPAYLASPLLWPFQPQWPLPRIMFSSFCRRCVCNSHDPDLHPTPSNTTVLPLTWPTSSHPWKCSLDSLAFWQPSLTSPNSRLSAPLCVLVIPFLDPCLSHNSTCLLSSFFPQNTLTRRGVAYQHVPGAQFSAWPMAMA